MKTQSIFIIVGSIVALTAPSTTLAQNCSLRNPDRQIYAMFPNATSYQSVVQPITPENLIEIEADLGSPLRLREVGKHTAYIVLEGTVPVGFVHARAEIGKRGALELVWGYDINLTLVDYDVQRCREKNSAAIKSDAFRAKLVGNDLKAFRALLTQQNKSVDLAALELPESASAIAHTAVLCGATTRVVTEIAFRDAILNARLLGNAHRFFPSTASVTKIRTSPDIGAPSADAPGDTINRAFDAQSLVVLRSLSEEKATLGAMVYAQWTAHPNAPELWLGVSARGSIVDAVLIGDVDEATRSNLAGLVGKQLPFATKVSHDSTTSPKKCVAELLVLLSQHGIGD